MIRLPAQVHCLLVLLLIDGLPKTRGGNGTWCFDYSEIQRHDCYDNESFLDN